MRERENMSWNIRRLLRYTYGCLRNISFVIDTYIKINCDLNERDLPPLDNHTWCTFEMKIQYLSDCSKNDQITIYASETGSIYVSFNDDLNDACAHKSFIDLYLLLMSPRYRILQKKLDI